MSSVKISSTFQASIIFILLICVTQSKTRSNAKILEDNIIHIICSKTQFISHCLEILQSTPVTDMKGIAKISLELAQSNANGTLGQLRSLIMKTSDPYMKKRYESCSKHLVKVINYVKYSLMDFIEGEYYGMNLHASAAMVEISDCDPSIKETQVLDRIIDIVLVISNFLHLSVYPINLRTLFY